MNNQGKGIKRKLFGESGEAGTVRSISNSSENSTLSKGEIEAMRELRAAQPPSKKQRNDNVERGETPINNIRPISPAPRYSAVTEVTFGGTRKRKRKTRRRKRKTKKRKRKKRKTRRKRKSRRRK